MFEKYRKVISKPKTKTFQTNIQKWCEQECESMRFKDIWLFLRSLSCRKLREACKKTSRYISSKSELVVPSCCQQTRTVVRFIDPQVQLITPPVNKVMFFEHMGRGCLGFGQNLVDILPTSLPELPT